MSKFQRLPPRAPPLCPPLCPLMLEELLPPPVWDDPILLWVLLCPPKLLREPTLPVLFPLLRPKELPLCEFPLLGAVWRSPTVVRVLLSRVRMPELGVTVLGVPVVCPL